jgi:hypothetical protein
MLIPVSDSHVVLGMELGVRVRKTELGEWVVMTRERGMRRETGHVLEEWREWLKGFVGMEVRRSRILA